MTVVKQNTPAADSTTWQPTKENIGGKESAYDFDAVVDAYLTGRKEGFDHGLSEMQRGITKLLKDNTSKAAKYTETILAYLNDQSIAAFGAFLKITSWDELQVLILVDQDSFLKPAFKEVYNLVYELEDVCEQANFTLLFSFAPHNKDFNITALNTDGFSLEYKNDNIAEAENHIK